MQMNKCHFCGKECGETILTVSDKTSFQSEQFRAYMCAECSEAVHSALILLRTITKRTVKHGRWECVGHDDTTYWYRCSVCGHEEHDNMTKHDNYCSNCGARMDGEDNG